MFHVPPTSKDRIIFLVVATATTTENFFVRLLLESTVGTVHIQVLCKGPLGHVLVGP